MRTCIERLISRAHIDSILIRNEVRFIEGVLEQVRVDGKISNDAFLDAGAVHGALSVIATHVELGISQKEIQQLLREQITRAEKINNAHPDLDKIIESFRV